MPAKRLPETLFEAMSPPGAKSDSLYLAMLSKRSWSSRKSAGMRPTRCCPLSLSCLQKGAIQGWETQAVLLRLWVQHFAPAEACVPLLRGKVGHSFNCALSKRALRRCATWDVAGK